MCSGVSLKPITYVAAGLGTAFAIPAADIVDACRAVGGGRRSVGGNAPEDIPDTASEDAPEDAMKSLTVVDLPSIRGRPRTLTLTVSDARTGGRLYKISVPCGPVRPLEAQRG